MDFVVGGFHEEEKDGKLFLKYHYPKYHPIPQTHSLSPSGEVAVSDDHLLQPLFLCPKARILKDKRQSTFALKSSPEYVFSTRSATDHHSILPLFWCNNKEFDVNGGCNICHHSNFGTDYYFCDFCKKMYHKECVESPLQIKHPYHSKHSLQLYCLLFSFRINYCLCCRRRVKYLVYYCTICKVYMHPICAMKPIPFVIDPPKRHDHPLTLFPRQDSLTCNFCGLVRKLYPTYICVRCNFVFHNDCMYSPRIIKISRHHHRIYYTFSLRLGEWFCRVCRERIDNDYGAYTCEKCSYYGVHSRCALEKNVWDGKDLEGVPEESDITQEVGPFDIISKGVILHFLHDHHLRLQVSIHYNGKNICQACHLPIFEGNLYSCMQCDFVLHESCAKARRIIQHALHPHLLTLKAASRYGLGRLKCSSCNRDCRGRFVYECCIRGCIFNLDVQCASNIGEPFYFQGHYHPLFLSLGLDRKLICSVCKENCYNQLNCIVCDFFVCMKCATLPYRARYKHDEHFLILVFEEEVREKDWCEVCEHNLRDTHTKMFYWCDECCTIFHVECVLGKVRI